MSRSICLATILSCAAAVPGAAQTTELSGPFSSAGEVHEFQLSPDGRRAVYSADQDVFASNELYSVSTDGRSEPVKLNGALAAGSASSPTFFPDETHIAYRARQVGDSYVGLYVGPLDGGTAAVKRSGPEGNVLAYFKISFDGVWLVYVATPDSSTKALYSVRADGSGSPTQLNIAGGGNHIMDFALSPDGSRVVYRSDEFRNLKYELFSVPTDGSSPRVRLHGSVSNMSDVSVVYRIDPTSQRVVFCANHDALGDLDLYSVPIDASAGPTRLNDPLAGQGVSGVRVSPDGQRVVYSADQDTAGVQELYSVGIDGSDAPIKLSGTLVSGGFVGYFEVDPSWTHVLYNGHQDDRVELYAVPPDGSSAPTRLNDPFPAGTSIGAFRITPDGGTVLFIESRFSPTFDFQLYAVPIDRSSSPRHLSGAPTIGTVGPFALDPSGSFVAFTSRQYAAPDTLYIVPLSGRRAPRAVGSFPRVEELDFASSSLRVIHRTDLMQFTSPRLFLTHLPKVAPR